MRKARPVIDLRVSAKSGETTTGERRTTKGLNSTPVPATQFLHIEIGDRQAGQCPISAKQSENENENENKNKNKNKNENNNENENSKPLCEI
jgi:hypothetical protein